MEVVRKRWNVWLARRTEKCNDARLGMVALGSVETGSIVLRDSFV